MPQLVDALIAEIELRKNEVDNLQLTSIYLGGGSPSILPDVLLQKLFDKIQHTFTITSGAEITIEANPDDVSTEKLSFIKQTPVNRFSMGVQSFFDEDLKWMNRAHNANQSDRSIKLIQDAGFDKISIDLIYGGPTLTHQHWQKNLEIVNALQLNHVSAYCLTSEPGTALQHQINAGKQLPLDEDKAAIQFDMMIDYLEGNAFEQYEISNFARNRQYAKHNTSYWQNKPYVGIGPSAHSFNGTQRSWNVANNQNYIRSIVEGKLPQEIEVLTIENRINEYLMTSLRTMWGCNWRYIKQTFGDNIYMQLKHKLQPYVLSGKLQEMEHGFKLNRNARFLADGIAADLFF